MAIPISGPLSNNSYINAASEGKINGIGCDSLKENFFYEIVEGIKTLFL